MLRHVSEISLKEGVVALTRIAIIGSGMTGLSCARRLARAGLSTVIFDKGRGIGGRVATRQTRDGYQFDHGAQEVSATEPAFAQVLAEAADAGALVAVPHDGDKQRYVGAPGMTAFPMHLGQGIERQQNAEVTSLEPQGDAWSLTQNARRQVFDRVICTAPAPQANALAGGHLTPRAFDGIKYEPCLTLMILLRRAPELPETAKNPTDAFAWVARDSAKPGRPAMESWVVQANAAWSRAHLEKDKDAIANLMRDDFLAHAELKITDVVYATAHRWRYAFVANPLGKPFVCNEERTLYAGGDWCLGPRVEDAWRSGAAMADHVLNTL